MSSRMKKFIALIGILALVAVSLSGCSSESTSDSGSSGSSSSSGSNSSDSSSSDSSSSDSSSSDSSETSTADSQRLASSDMFTDRDKEIGYDEATAVTITLADGASSCGSSSVSIDGDTVTIGAEGTYILSGSLSDGQVQVNVDSSDKVQLVLDNVSISNSSSAAIYIISADKVFVTMAEGSSNTLSTTGEFVDIDENSIDGVIFSKDDLTLNGNGTLTITCAAGHGIVSKDDLVLTSGTYIITAEKNALSGKDSVRIADGVYTLTAGNDAIHSENEDDASKGYIYIAGGSFTLTSTGTTGGDGIDSSSIAQIEGGEFTISTTYGKGVKGEGGIYLDGAAMTINSNDDAIHSGGVLEVTDGSYTITTGDDGFHSDDSLTISGGTIDIQKSYEGLEGMSITISGGTIRIVSSDDGMNAAGGTDSSGFGGGFGRDNFNGSSSSDYSLTISGGLIYVNAGGDGLDSNGTLIVTGGEVYISGPTSSADGAIDYESSGIITGGIVIAAGASGMAENFGSASTQGCALINLSGSQSGTITLTDSDGNVLASFDPEKQYSSVVISCPDMVQGETYTLTTGSTSTELELTSLVYSSGSGGMGGGMGGGNGGFGGGNGGGGGRR